MLVDSRILKIQLKRNNEGSNTIRFDSDKAPVIIKAINNGFLVVSREGDEDFGTWCYQIDNILRIKIDPTTED